MRNQLRTFAACLTVFFVFCLAPTEAAAQSSLSIVSPASGTVERQGTTFTLTFSSTSNLFNLAVVGEFPGSWSQTQAGSSAFAVTVPASTPVGNYALYVLGSSSNGQVIASAPITISVDSGSTVTSLYVLPKTLQFAAVGDVGHLEVRGTLADGTSGFITESPQVSYSSANPSIASVTSEGVVTAIAPGSTTVSVAGPSGSQSQIPVLVPAPPIATPSLAPLPGSYSTAQQVTVVEENSAATLYYTLDNSPPTPNSSRYTGPIPITKTTTINVLAYVSGFNAAVTWGTYTIAAAVPVPSFTPPSGTFASSQAVSITDTLGGAVIYYTTDGSTPTTSSMLYSSPISVNVTETIQAIAVANGYTNSAVASATYTINIPTAALPAFSPTAGTFTAAQTVTISDSTPGTAVYYTVNGPTPTASSTLYTGPISVSSTETIQAIAAASGYSNSPVASAVYTINLPQDFTFGLSASSLTIAPGQSGTVTASIGPVNGFNQPVSFACSGLPARATCSFSPNTITPNGTASGTTTVTITASAMAGLLDGNRPYELAGLVAGLSLLFAGRRFRRLGRVGGLLLLIIGAGSFVGCGGGSPAAKSTPTTSTVSITATSGSLAHTASLSLTVQ